MYIDRRTCVNNHDINDLRFISIHYFRNLKFVRVGSLVGRYFYVFIKIYLKLCLTIIYFNVYITLDFPITYSNDLVSCQSECACLHKTINMVVFFG